MTLDLEGAENLPIEFFTNKIQNIINKYHKEQGKKNIKKYPMYKPKRLNFACPYCGDSQKVATKYRGNVWLNSMMYTCFNCGTKVSFTKLCDDFEENVEIEDRIKIYNYIDSKTYSKEDYSIKSLDKLIDIKEWIDFMNTHERSWLSNISPVVKNSSVYQYLVYDRNIKNHQFIYQGIYRKFKGDRCYWQTPVMILLNASSDKLLGIQLRNLEKDRNKRFYKIIEFEDLYNFMYQENPLDEIEASPYNKLSHFYNILNIDFDEKITIFEGFLDSLFCKNNSIGMVGSNNDNDLLNFLTSADDDLNLQFFYDGDEDGNRKANKMMDKGYPVFLWKKLKEDLAKISKNTYYTENLLKNVIDLNDLVILYKNDNIYRDHALNEYFSVDDFDKIYLDKVKRFF
jgi:transcription elongation factor Elf1